MFAQRLYHLYALKLSESKQYRQAWNPKTNAALFAKFKNHWLDRKGYRLWFPAAHNAPQSKAQSATQIAVEKSIDALRVNGATFSVLDYIDNKAVNNKTKQIIAISKLLSKNNKDLLEAFNNDKTRVRAKSAENIVVISRHPHDVAGMSTDRGWTSCMNIRDGFNRRYVLNDVKAGTLIAYLVKKDDTNIKKPSARVLIKPFTEDLSYLPKQRTVREQAELDELLADEDFEREAREMCGIVPPKKPGAQAGTPRREDFEPRILYVKEENQYGTHSEILDRVVEDFLEKVNEGIDGTFCINEKLYQDSDTTEVEVEDGKITPISAIHDEEELLDDLQEFMGDTRGLQGRIQQLKDKSNYIQNLLDDTGEQYVLAQSLIYRDDADLIYPVLNSLLTNFSYAEYAANAGDTDSSLLGFVRATENQLEKTDFKKQAQAMFSFCDEQLDEETLPPNLKEDHGALIEANARLLRIFIRDGNDEIRALALQALLDMETGNALSVLNSLNDSQTRQTAVQKYINYFERNNPLFYDFINNLNDLIDPSSAIHAINDIHYKEATSATPRVTRLGFLLGQWNSNFVVASPDKLVSIMTDEAKALLIKPNEILDFYTKLDDSDWKEFSPDDPEYTRTWGWLYEHGYFKSVKGHPYYINEILPELGEEE